MNRWNNSLKKLISKSNILIDIQISGLYDKSKAKLAIKTKNWLDFNSPKLKVLKSYQKILFSSSSGCKILLYFTCLTIKFHNWYHANPHTCSRMPNGDPWIIPITKQMAWYIRPSIRRVITILLRFFSCAIGTRNKSLL